MKSPILLIRAFLIVALMLLYACDKVTVETSYPPLVVHKKDEKPNTPVQLGTIRGYFGNYYRTFDQHIERVQPIDSFSNAYFYSNCKDAAGQINLIRCDSAFIFAIYIMGYSLDSLPASLPVPSEYGKYTEIQFYPYSTFNWGTPGHYLMIDFYGKSVFITDRTNDILTGTFEGTLRSSNGNNLPVTEGEFKLKIFRKFMPCSQNNRK